MKSFKTKYMFYQPNEEQKKKFENLGRMFIFYEYAHYFFNRNRADC